MIKDEEARLGACSRAVHAICLHLCDRLPVRSAFIPVQATPTQTWRQFHFPLIPDWPALWLALAREGSHTIWLLGLTNLLLFVPLLFFFFLTSWKPAALETNPTVLLERGYVGRECWGREGSAQPAPGCPSRPSWSARRGSKAIW